MTHWRNANWQLTPRLMKLPTPEDGSCLVHSIIGGITERHKRNMTSSDPSARELAFVRVQDIRVRSADFLGKYYSQLFGGWEDVHYEEEDGKLRGYDRETLDRMLRDPSVFLTQEFAILLSELFSVNILFLDEDREAGYPFSAGPLYYSEERKGTILVLYSESRKHFTLAGIELSEGNVVTHFLPNATIIAPFRRLNKVSHSPKNS